MRLVLVLAVVASSAALARTDEVEKFLGVDLQPNSVTLDRKPGKGTGYVTANCTNSDGKLSSGYVGFPIPNKYRGKPVVLRARVAVDEGKVGLAIDDFGKAPVAQSPWWGAPGERIYEFATQCPRHGNLLACITLEAGSRVRVLVFSIEFAD